MKRAYYRPRHASDGSAEGRIAELFIADRWRTEHTSVAAIEARLSSDVGEALIADVERLSGVIVAGCCARLGLPYVPPVVVREPELAIGEYEIVLGGAVRVAGSLGTSWRDWWVDHPVAGPGGRTRAAPAPLSIGTDLEPAQKVARAVEEAVWDDPGLLLSDASAASIAYGVGIYAPVSEPEAWASVFRTLARRRVPLVDTDKLEDSVRDVEMSDAISRVEVLSCACRPYEVRVRLGSDLQADLSPNNAESRFQAELLPFLHEWLSAELGIGFPEIEIAEADDLADRAYEIVINGLPRACGEIPRSKTLINVEPQSASAHVATASTNIDPQGVVNPASGFIATWIDDAAATTLSPFLMKWNAEEFLILHLASCLREAAPEFADLAWTQQLLERLIFEADLADLVTATDRLYTREFIAAVLGRLAEEEVSIRDLVFILERMLEHAAAANTTNRRGNATGSLSPHVLEVAESVRSQMKDALSHVAAQAWGWGDGAVRPVVRRMAVFSLEERAEEALAGLAQQRSADACYGFAASGALLRSLRQLLEGWSRPLPPVLLTSQAARPHLRRLVAAQFPRLKVLAREELSSDVKVEQLAAILLPNRRSSA